MKKFEKIILKAANDNHARHKISRAAIAPDKHPVVNAIKKNKIKSKKLLEIGCSTGFVLKKISSLTNAKCYGIDASRKAINDGKKLFKDIKLFHGIIEESKLKKEKFDLIILGFFLFLMPPNKILDLFNIVDNMLKINGQIIIYDMHNIGFKKKNYKHNINLSTFRWDFKNVFLSLPYYKLVHKKIDRYKKSNDKTEISILRKVKI